MEIRAVRESELEEMIALQCKVFRSDGYERYTQYIRGDSSYTLDQTRIVLENGRIVSTLRIWDRELRIGAGTVRMGGIGGVGTDPDHRGRGYASALVQEAVEHMHQAGYDAGMLFSVLPCSFYRRLGWGSLPMEGFRIRRASPTGPKPTSWTVEVFSEEDLEQVVSLYDRCNAGLSGSLVRQKSYWDSTPARMRRILPTVVARHRDRVGGYLNYDSGDGVAVVLEVASDSEDGDSLVSLANHLIQHCEDREISEIHGELPQDHPLVHLLADRWDGDLTLTGHDKTMLYAANLRNLLDRLLAGLQARAGNGKSAPRPIRLDLNGQQCVVRLGALGIEIVDSDPKAFPLTMPPAFFWRLAFGQASWNEILPVLQAMGHAVPSDVSDLLTILFPAREVICWAPDHF